MACLSQTPTNLSQKSSTNIYNLFLNYFVGESDISTRKMSTRRVLSIKSILVRNITQNPINPSQEDMQKFLGVEKKEKFENIKGLSIASWRVINLKQLKEYHCPISDVFKDQNLKFFLQVYGLKVFKDLVHLFYVNLDFSKHSRELDTSILDTRNVFNDFLFAKVFDIETTGCVPI